MVDSQEIERIARKVADSPRKLMVFDRDGTIVPYADHPDLAVMADSLKETIRALVAIPGIDVAILSARAIHALERDFGADDQVILAGNYGLELRLPDGSDFVEARARESIEELKDIKLRLESLTDERYKGILEDHRLSLCLHWHRVEEGVMDEFRRQVLAIAGGVKTVRLETYPTSFEFFPDMEWTKGDGLDLIAAKCGVNGASDCITLFCGDTDSDEPAMKRANERGGISVRVGTNPVSTAAKYKFERPAQVEELLSQILNLS